MREARDVAAADRVKADAWVAAKPKEASDLARQLRAVAAMTTGARPRLMVVAGPNRAGKTIITGRGLAHEWFQGCEYIKPDLIAQGELGDWNDAATVLRAAQLATERREARLRDGRSLASETVFSGPGPELASRQLSPASPGVPTAEKRQPCDFLHAVREPSRFGSLPARTPAA